MSRGRKVIVLLTALTIAAGVVPTFATPGYDYTDIKYPGFNPEEPSHAEILGEIYSPGTGFVADGLNYRSADSSMWAYRVYDIDEEFESVHVVTGDQSNVDQIWTDGYAQVSAEARYAAHDQSFGWNLGGLDPCYTELLTDTDVGNGPVDIEIFGDFLWGTNPINGGENLWWSKNSLNNGDGGSDHLVTYLIEGLATEKTVWMLFWEDLPSSGWDQDYNDFVIEVRAIPEPATVFLLGLGALALLRKRRP